MNYYRPQISDGGCSAREVPTLRIRTAAALGRTGETSLTPIGPPPQPDVQTIRRGSMPSVPERTPAPQDDAARVGPALPDPDDAELAAPAPDDTGCCDG